MVAEQRPEQRPEPDASAAAAPDQAEAAERAEAAATAAALADLEDRWRRALADLDNLRKRYTRELERERAAERARVAAELLPVVDNLDLALAHADARPDAIVEGVRTVRDQALEALTRLGYPRDEEVEVPFDAARHEAVKVVEGADAAPGTVVEVVRPGYGRGDRWLRPAAVAVAVSPKLGGGRWRTTSTRSLAYHAMPVPRSCSRPTGSWPAGTTRT